MLNKKRGLGRGLSSLIPTTDGNVETINNENLRDIPLAKIVPNPNQPRQKVDEKNLVELMESIKMHGLIQPIIVRPAKKTGFEIIAGERRGWPAKNWTWNMYRPSSKITVIWKPQQLH